MQEREPLDVDGCPYTIWLKMLWIPYVGVMDILLDVDHSNVCSRFYWSFLISTILGWLVSV